MARWTTAFLAATLLGATLLGAPAVLPDRDRPGELVGVVSFHCHTEPYFFLEDDKDNPWRVEFSSQDAIAHVVAGDRVKVRGIFPKRATTPRMRDGMSAMLENESDFSIVASVANGEAAVEHCRRAGFPDVTVMDIRMPGLDGFATLERMKRFKPDVAVLLLAGMPLKAEEEKARQLGARGYLPKSMDWERLVAAIRHAAAADIDFLMEGYDDEKIGPLSAREKEILGYLALGKTHEEIAIIGGISPETVRSHVKGIFRKLDCPNAAAAVGRAYELGILRA